MSGALTEKEREEKEVLLQRITHAEHQPIPRFDGMQLITSVQDSFYLYRTWNVYISHDPCHDTPKRREDRNTVIAFCSELGSFRIIGRELPHKMALALARGKDLKKTKGRASRQT
jgi:hypothetical protein